MEQKEFSDTIFAPRPGPLASKNPESAKPWYLIGPGIWERHLNGSDDNRSVLQ